MARTVPVVHTWFNGEIPTYKHLNTYLYDALSFAMNPPLLRLRQTIPQNFNSGNIVAVIFDTSEAETDQFWDGTNPTVILPTIPGWYAGTAKGTWAANATGYRQVEVTKNSSATVRSTRFQVPAPSAGTTVSSEVMFVEQFNGTTDFITMSMFQNSGVTLAAAADISQGPTLTLRWLAAL